MKSTSPLRVLLWGTVFAAAISGCGDGDGGSGRTSQSPGPTIEEDPEITSAGLHSGGGAAQAQGSSGEGRGGAGGTLRVRAEQAIRLSSSAAAPSAPGLPVPPASGTILTEADLEHDVALAGHILITGTLSASGAGSVRSITSLGGDIVVSGNLHRGQMAGFILRAPSGTIFVSGLLSAESGSIELDAAQVAISGRIVTAGALDLAGTGGVGGPVSITTTSGPLLVSGGSIRTAGGSGIAGGGNGGDVTLRSADALRLHGEVNSRGGSAQGAASGLRAGHGGDLTLEADGPLETVATLRIRGGAARSSGEGAQGGRGGDLVVEGRVAARLYGTLDARGGSATAQSTGSGLGGGAAGSILAGQATALLTLETGPGSLVLAGGEGGESGGNGGPATIYSSSGDIVLAGTVDASGGDSARAPGQGAALSVQCDVGGGSIFGSATLRTRGGSATDPGVSAPGGAAGRIDLVTSSTPGAIQTDSASFLDLDGGASGGDALAGAGGEVRMIIPDAFVSVGGRIHARGGNATGAGGTGGRGGLFWVVSDDNANSEGGDITLEAGSVFDLSGGTGAVGGHARHDDTTSASTDPERCCVILDSESGLTRNMGGIIRNNGSIIARGGAQNGWGGDVTFHGRGHDANRDPVEGSQDRAGHGSGRSGDYLSD